MKNKAGICLWTVAFMFAAATASAQDPHAGHQMPTASAGWSWMQDGVVYGVFNRQDGPRGGSEFMMPNWWMGMASKTAGRHQISFNAMFSLEPATVGKDGYRELFQVGEALDGQPLIDRQHPHDFIMQLSASWRMKVSANSAVTLSGGPAGEATLGPTAFMHRPSARGLLMAPLGHHAFDSTHIVFGVAAAGIEWGPITLEGSVFNGREPDEDRWDFDFGRMDSKALRLRVRPKAGWDAQVSHGWLTDPEELVPGDARRTTATVSWTGQRDGGLRALTVGYGLNNAHGEKRHGIFGEFTLERGPYTFASRAELQQVEAETLLFGGISHCDDTPGIPCPIVDVSGSREVAALTLAAARRVLTWRKLEGALGGQLVINRPPGLLESTHGTWPVSFQVFFKLSRGGPGR